MLSKPTSECDATAIAMSLMQERQIRTYLISGYERSSCDNRHVADQSPRTRYLYFQNSIRTGIVDELAESLGRRME